MFSNGRLSTFALRSSRGELPINGEDVRGVEMRAGLPRAGLDVMRTGRGEPCSLGLDRQREIGELIIARTGKEEGNDLTVK